MSESEKLLRDEYQKKRKKIIYIFGAIVLVLTILTTTFSLIFVNMDAETYVSFHEDGTAVYHAYLNDNAFYEEERLNGNHAYVSSLIHHMDAAFLYKAQMDVDDAVYQYQYRVDAQLVVQDKHSGAAIYNPTETLLGPTAGTHTGQILTINPTVEIDYVHYNNQAKRFIEEFSLVDVTAHLDVTLFVDIVGMSESFASDNEGQYTVNVHIPLNQATLKPETTSTIPTGPQKVLANPNQNKVVFKILAIVFGILDLAGVIAAVIYILKTRDAHIDYARKVKRLVGSYKSFIQKINTPFNREGYQVLSVDTFNEMLEIRDTLQLPILMYENEDKTCTTFLIPTTAQLLYLFEIKVDNYDELYASIPTEEELAEQAPVEGESAEEDQVEKEITEGEITEGENNEQPEQAQAEPTDQEN